MHSNNFVLAIKDNSGKSLRENRSGEVFLPFGSEYKLHLKNDNYRRALVKVSIDGTDVTGLGLVLNANSSIDLERFLVDGNLTSGKKFKFVSVNDPAVSDPGSSGNGLISVQFTLEKTPIWNIGGITYIPYESTGIPFKWKPAEIWCDSASSGSGIYKSRSVGITSESYTSDMGQVTNSNSVQSFCCQSPNLSPNFSGQIGATVEGGNSSQAFVTTRMDELETATTTLTLRLLAPASAVVPITSSDTKKVHCSSCNSKVRWDDAFCWKCGNKLIHQEMVKE